MANRLDVEHRTAKFFQAGDHRAPEVKGVHSIRTLSHADLRGVFAWGEFDNSSREINGVQHASGHRFECMPRNALRPRLGPVSIVNTLERC